MGASQRVSRNTLVHLRQHPLFRCLLRVIDDTSSPTSAGLGLVLDSSMMEIVDGLDLDVDSMLDGFAASSGRMNPALPGVPTAYPPPRACRKYARGPGYFISRLEEGPEPAPRRPPRLTQDHTPKSPPDDIATPITDECRTHPSAHQTNRKTKQTTFTRRSDNTRCC